MVSISLIAVGIAMKILALGETSRFSLGGAIMGIGFLFLVIVFLTALRTLGKKDRVAEDERTKKIYGKTAVSSLFISVPLSILFGAYVSSDPKLMMVVSSMNMLLIPVGFFAVVYV